MDNPGTARDPLGDRFEAWLQRPAVQPPADLLARVRARLADPEAELERTLERLLEQDPALANPRMAGLVRARLRAESSFPDRPVWFRWLVPLAAAATLAVAFLSFQARAPHALPGPVAAALPEYAAAEDTQLTEIFALAANLHGGTDFSKLESVENLAFLFD